MATARFADYVDRDAQNHGMPLRFTFPPHTVVGKPRATLRQYVEGNDQVTGEPLMQKVINVLTGPASLAQRQLVQIIGEAIGRSLHFEELSHESAREQMLASGWAPPVADMLLNAYAAGVGRVAPVTSTVSDVTGTPARSFHDWAADHAGDFAAPSYPGSQ